MRHSFNIIHVYLYRKSISEEKDMIAIELIS